MFLVIPLVQFVLSIYNAITIRTIKPTDSRLAASTSVEVLLPMRNEAANARECISTIMANKNSDAFRVTALDDGSSDGTLDILNSISEISVIQGKELPQGWIGKSFALQQLADQSSAEYLVFVDADVRLHPQAITSSITLMQADGLDYLSPYPREIANSFVEKLMQPLLQWSFFATLPLRATEGVTRSSVVVANGQFFIVKADAFRAVEGYHRIKDKVLDDLALARSLRTSGFRGTVADGSRVATCRMYSSRSELFAGYRKSLWSAAANPFAVLMLAALITATNFLPFLFSFYGAIALVLSRVITAAKTRSSIWSSLLHPLAILVLLYLFASSLRAKSRGELQWRGRTINPYA